MSQYGRAQAHSSFAVLGSWIGTLPLFERTWISANSFGTPLVDNFKAGTQQDFRFTWLLSHASPGPRPKLKKPTPKIYIYFSLQSKLTFGSYTGQWADYIDTGRQWWLPISATPAIWHQNVHQLWEFGSCKSRILESWQDTAVKMVSTPSCLLCPLIFIFCSPCTGLIYKEMNANSHGSVHGSALCFRKALQ